MMDRSSHISCCCDCGWHELRSALHEANIGLGIGFALYYKANNSDHHVAFKVPFLHISYYNYSCFHVDSNRSTSGSQGDLRYVLFYNSIKDFYPDPGCPRIFFYDLMFRLHLKIDKPDLDCLDCGSSSLSKNICKTWSLDDAYRSSPKVLDQKPCAGN
ncbi:hypothetical protein C5167_000811 [Papaver somniferum]|uniref:Uncharacterized protein n=1 Tax=Papaver somniferum TaxID=3469 RepID=A0A4Y7KV86_PAPSO|nr:hypothetical protein C5167_000811 [Papaver somniferum]